MDDLYQESPWTPFLYIMDRIEWLWHDNTGEAFVLLSVLLWYFFMGSRLDLLINALLIIFWSSDKFLHLLRGYIDLYSVPTLAGLSLVYCVFLAYHSGRKRAWPGPGQPFLIPGRTTHSRRYPKKHSFSYSYLTVGVPVGFRGNVKGMLEVEEQQSTSLLRSFAKLLSSGWYTVHASDYLERGHGKLGLRGKLDNYLRSQNVEPAEFPHAYLVTAARFLGYHFNPVSFWYLYSADKILSGIVLEVNNTFDERRPYLVMRDFAAEATCLPVGSDAPEPRPRVRGMWAKDFHVSPFNSRKGTYSVLASDPLGPGMVGFRGIDVTINLSSSKGHPKLVARLLSEGPAVDPAGMGIFSKLVFLSKWFWVGFATFPRIVKEAAALFFRRSLHVWYRPEPGKESLGRNATSAEADVEAFFRRYLEFLVSKSSAALCVRYIASGIASSPTAVFTSPTWRGAASGCETLELRVLTPVFYTRFVHYAHDFEAIFTELAENSTVWVNEPKLLPDLFLKKGSPPIHSTNPSDYMLSRLMRSLRRRPPTIPRVSTSADPPTEVPLTVDIRDFRMSSMDAYMFECGDGRLKETYLWTLVRLFIADRYLMGSVELLNTAILLFRIGIAWGAASSLTHVIQTFTASAA